MNKENNSPAEIGPAKVLGVLKLSMQESATKLVQGWNESEATIESNDAIDVRFVEGKGKIKHDKVKAQAHLTLEIKRNSQWTVVSRKVVNFPSMVAMDKAGVLYELELWSLMFVEITQMGLLSAISLVQHRQQTNDHSTQKHPLSPDQAVSEADLIEG